MEAIDQIIKWCDEEKEDKGKLVRLLEFAAAGLNYLPTTEFQPEDIVANIVRYAVGLGAKGVPEALKSVAVCLRKAGPREALVKEVVKETFLTLCSQSEDAERQVVLAIASATEPAWGLGFSGRLSREWSLLPDVGSAFGKGGSDVLTRSRVDMFYRRIALEWGLANPSDVVEHDGLEPFFAVGLIDPRLLTMDLIGKIALAAFPGMLPPTWRIGLDAGASKDFLRTLGRTVEAGGSFLRPGEKSSLTGALDHSSGCRSR